MVNRIIILGRIGKDPEVRRLTNGVVVAKFSLATNDNYKNKDGEWCESTEWHDVVCWRNLAERAESTLKKGAQVYVEGKLTHRTWQDEYGNNRRTTEIVANYFRTIYSRSSEVRVGEDRVAINQSFQNEKKEKVEGVDDDLPF